MQMSNEHYIVGCDLGQSQDYTAIAVVERVRIGEPPGMRPAVTYGANGTWMVSDGGGAVAGNSRSYTSGDPALRGIVRPVVSAPPPQRMVPGVDTRPVEYHVRHLERPPLGTKYPAIVRRVGTLLATPPLSRVTPLVVDRTGVGAAVADMFAGAGVTPHAVTITGGDETITDGSYHTKVPKRELVGTLVAVFQTDRLKIAAGLAEGATLVNELVNFKVKVNLATGHDSYEAWRESVHDDLVLAVALAVWHGERGLPDPTLRQWNYLYDDDDEQA